MADAPNAREVADRLERNVTPALAGLAVALLRAQEDEIERLREFADGVWKGSALRRTMQEMERTTAEAIDRAIAAEAALAEAKTLLDEFTTCGCEDERLHAIRAALNASAKDGGRDG